MTTSTRFNVKTAAAVRGVTLLAILGLIVNSFGPLLRAQQQQAPKLAPEQKVLHVLNRLGFGARPGDMERVKMQGIENYVNEQLSPEKIADPVAEGKVRNLATLNMSTAELYKRFPQPGMLVRQLQRQGKLPSDLAQAREDRAKGGDANSQKNGELKETQAEMATQNKPPADETNPTNPLANEKYRRAVRDYYEANGLQLPQRITAELQASRILRAVYSERQLQEVMVDFWTNHFNVFAGKGADRWLLVSYDRDTIRPNAMGRFQDLLLATAKSPAMLFYLDNFQSVSPNAQAGQRQRAGQRGTLLDLLTGNRRRERVLDRDSRSERPSGSQPPAQPLQRQRRGINENYARELMELHTLGVDGGYTQKDVQEVARCFTGWTILAPRGGGAAAAALLGEGARTNAGSFYFAPRMHDDGEKMVLGHKIPAGGGMKDGLMVLEILAHHPATGKFIATKLVRHFVSDNPPSALVDRVASTYNKKDGNIREMLRTIFFSPEFNSPENYRAKIKRPFELAVSAIRTLGAETNGGPQVHQWIARMGQPLYGYQTPNGYSDTAEAWVNTGALLERLNFGLALASNRIPGTRVDLTRLVAEESSDPEQTMNRFVKAIVAGDMSSQTRETLRKQLNDQPIVLAPASQEPARMSQPGDEEMMAGPRRRLQLARAEANITDPVTKIVGLILGSPEFQRQ
jgi:uncharacterized protein (DUF1800 family)